jgi:hypothetical protein
MTWKTIILFAWLVCGSVAVSAESTNAWQRTDRYVAPDFDGYFPDDPAGGEKLADLERSHALEKLPPEETLAAVRGGLRTTGAHRLSILRTIGNRFIWNRSPQNPDAIELMYHAAGFSEKPDPQSTRHFAIYFGPSVVQPKTPNLLRMLAETCLDTDDPNILSRIAWGVKSQREEFTAFLKPALDSEDPPKRDKGRLVKKIIDGEIEAFAWASDVARQKAEATFSKELPEIKRILSGGTSGERKEVLEKISKHRIALIMDESFVPAFSACARDVDPRVRDGVAKTAGDQWIWNAKTQDTNAIELALLLSRDTSENVRYNALYYGLSTVRSPGEPVVRRLMQMLFKEPVSDSQRRIFWALGRENLATNNTARKILAEYLNDPDPKAAALAREIYQGWIQSGAEKVETREATPEIAAKLRAELTRRVNAAFKPFLIRLAGGETALVTSRASIAFGENVLTLIGAHDHIRLIEIKQIAELLDLP